MAHFNIQPSGIMSPLGESGRKPIIKVTGGDSWTFTANLHVPFKKRIPASPENTYVTITLSETQFDDALWSGEWYSGIYPDDNRPGLVAVVIPNSITKSLRRGSYTFSIRVSDLLKTQFVTEQEGSFLVEYKPTSEQHSIPYKDGTWDLKTDDGDTKQS